MKKGFVYILECSDGTFYTGSTIDLDLRVTQHQTGNGANHTKKRLPVKLVFIQEFTTIVEAFNREKQIQGWSRKKKEALINSDYNNLKKYSECQNQSHCKYVASTPLSHQPYAPINQQKNIFYSHGKLLLTGEYIVLDGALALAVPTKYGQTLTINPIDEFKLIWKSLDEKGNIWFEDELLLYNEISRFARNDNEIRNRLLQILKAVKQLNLDFLKNNIGFEITTELEFPNNWGLGTSSTLINNIANWANVDAYKLLELTFGGSGYDIACANHDSAITYKLFDGSRQVESISFKPNFSDNLFFIHLNKKQDSRKEIAKYEVNKSDIKASIEEVNTITNQIINCNSLDKFESLITYHETIISKLIKQTPIKEELFSNYKGAIKSLGAWGGDFILATGSLDDMDYFRKKGFQTILSFDEMVLDSL